jgi:hypothetical protein
MSTVTETSSRTWWFSPKPVNASKSGKLQRRSLPERSQKPSSGPRLSLAAVLGLKSKKHPSLAIEDPPVTAYAVQPSVQLPSVIHLQIRQPNTNRPPSKSVSSTLRSSLELRTPSDNLRLPFGQSLLSLSDPDPFASQGIVPTTKLDQKPSLTDSPTLQPVSKRSLAPPSSESHSPVSPVSPLVNQPPSPLFSQQSERTNAILKCVVYHLPCPDL